MTTLSKADYLKRYMSDTSTEKPKKRRKKVQNQNVPVKKIVKSRIVDDDVDLKSIANKEETDPYADDENPTVAEVIDERPEHVKELEKYRNEKWKQVDNNKKPRYDSDSDTSPIRRTRHDSDSDNDNVTIPKGKSDKSHPNLGLDRLRRHDSDSDQSPQRGRNDSDSDQSPPRGRKSTRMDSDSDLSPRRRNSKSKNTQNIDSDQSPLRPRSRRGRNNSDSDQSPPRTKSKRGKMNSDSDQSPLRTKKPKTNSDSDQSPPRQSRRSNSPDQTVKTSRGAKAGLSSAKEMRDEMKKLRKKEEDAFRRMDKSNTGENAATVIRDKSGKIVDMHAEMKKDREKREKDEKYSRWSKGVTQQTVQNERVEDAIHEMSKPLARYQDDNDLDATLKEQDRDGDPMLAFMKSKKTKKSKQGKSMPRYSGPAPPPNRFNIAPGYRWDGVDRYNGYERKYFEQINARKAKSQAAFQWSTEDM